MTTLNEFNLLSETEQDEIITDHGLFLINDVQGDNIYDVYKLFDYYVKICYGVNDDREPSISAFADLTLFEKNFSQ